MLKKIGMMVAVAALVSAASYVYAGSTCCSSKKAKSSEMSACASITATMDLSDEQKAKIAEIEASCQAAGGSEQACTKAKGEIRDVLNDDQKAAFDAAWEKKAGKKGGCG